MRLGLVLAITFAATTATAHVGPSTNDNNRYLKLTPAKDRVRLAYTVFFGEVPGAKMRQSLDTDRDGAISEAEAQTFGDKLADEVAAGLDIQLDKVQTRLRFGQVVVGMGSPQVRAGSFSVDLIAELCLPPGTDHAVVMRDRFRLLNPGETEVRIEDGQGIAIQSARIGASRERQVKYAGPGGPLSDDGIELRFDTSAAPPSASGCATPSSDSPPRGIPAILVIGAGALVAFALAVVVTLVRRRKAAS